MLRGGYCTLAFSCFNGCQQGLGQVVGAGLGCFNTLLDVVSVAEQLRYCHYEPASSQRL